MSADLVLCAFGGLSLLPAMQGYDLEYGCQCGDPECWASGRLWLPADDAIALARAILEDAQLRYPGEFR